MMSAAEKRRRAHRRGIFYLPAPLEDGCIKNFKLIAGDKIDGHETYMVVGHTEGQPPLRLYLDKESGLPAAPRSIKKPC